MLVTFTVELFYVELTDRTFVEPFNGCLDNIQYRQAKSCVALVKDLAVLVRIDDLLVGLNKDGEFSQKLRDGAPHIVDIFGDLSELDIKQSKARKKRFRPYLADEREAAA